VAVLITVGSSRRAQRALFFVQQGPAGWTSGSRAKIWRRFRSERLLRACRTRRWSRACCTSTHQGGWKRC